MYNLSLVVTASIGGSRRGRRGEISINITCGLSPPSILVAMVTDTQSFVLYKINTFFKIHTINCQVCDKIS